MQHVGIESATESHRFYISSEALSAPLDLQAAYIPDRELDDDDDHDDDKKKKKKRERRYYRADWPPPPC